MWGRGVEGGMQGQGHACEAAAAWLKMRDVGLFCGCLIAGVDCLMCR